MFKMPRLRALSKVTIWAAVRLNVRLAVNVAPSAMPGVQLPASLQIPSAFTFQSPVAAFTVGRPSEAAMISALVRHFLTGSDERARGITGVFDKSTRGTGC